MSVVNNHRNVYTPLAALGNVSKEAQDVGWVRLRIQPVIAHNGVNVDPRHILPAEHGDHRATGVGNGLTRSGLQEFLKGDDAAASKGAEHNRQGVIVRVHLSTRPNAHTDALRQAVA